MMNARERTLRYDEMDSPVGTLLLAASEQAVRVIGFDSGRKRRGADPAWRRADDAILRETRDQLAAYFAGERQRFDLPLEPIGTRFQQDVWAALRDVPYAQTVSYGEIARRIGRPGAARAVGAACGENPLPIAIPCHRVVGSSGSLTGFGGGLDAKKKLLAVERETR